MNTQARFCARYTWDGHTPLLLRVAGATLYRVRVNGRFALYGPARSPHGYARVDEMLLSAFSVPGENTLEVEVAGYVCGCFYHIGQPSFVQAEVLCGSHVLACTGYDFMGYLVGSRVRKVMRYSYQRAFCEVWDFFTPDGVYPIEIMEPEVTFLPRGFPLPDYQPYCALGGVQAGTVAIDSALAVSRPRYVAGISDIFPGFAESEIDQPSYFLWQRMKYRPKGDAPFQLPCAVYAGDYITLDMGQNRTGFVQLSVLAQADSTVFIIFDEKLIDGIIDWRQIGMINLIEYRLPQSGTPYTLESFEAYGFRYASIIVLRGQVQVNRFGVRGYQYSVPAQSAVTSDAQLQRIYQAALETFRQNTLDVFMDCPTRERGAWLCDSYFTGQAEYLFTGRNEVERVFLENYRLYTNQGHLPEGMLPMCYPAEHQSGEHIPQWALWYILELYAYHQRHVHEPMAPYRSLCYALLGYCKHYENTDGLLEDLPGWNFIEWSRANEWVSGISYPTNMLYAKVLDIISQLYGDTSLRSRATDIRRKIIAQSFDGSFFSDHTVRDADNRLVNPGVISEACQYYAFFTGTTDEAPALFRPLRDRLIHEFGPKRDAALYYTAIEKATMFMGNYLRMELLLRWGEWEHLLEEVQVMFSGMAEETGTLWEHPFQSGSLNHGFAAYAGVAIAEGLRMGACSDS